MAEFTLPSFLARHSEEEIYQTMREQLPADIDSSEGSHVWNFLRPTAMVAADGLRFSRAIRVGDVVSCYGRVLRVGSSSLTLGLEVWVMPVMPEREGTFRLYKAGEGNITYVSLGPDGKKQVIDRALLGDRLPKE